MNKTIIASAILATLTVPAASAIEIYKDDNNAVSIGGFVDVRAINTQGVSEVVNGASRINFAFERKLGNDWTAFTKLEWGVNPVGNSEIAYNNNFETGQNDFFYNRLGYVGISHDTWGSLTLGKQWGAWYDVVEGTNYGFVWDGNAAGVYTYNKDDGGVNGVGRGDKVIQYRNSIGDFSFAVQAQLKQDSFYICDLTTVGGSCEDRWFDPANDFAQRVEFNHTYGASLTWRPMEKLSIAIGGNHGEFDVTLADGASLTATDSIYGIGATWGNFDANGFYASANVNHNKNHDTDNLGNLIKEAYGVETLFSYKFDNGFRTLISYNLLDAGDDYVVGPYTTVNAADVFKRQFLVAGVHYVWDNGVVVYLEGRKDFSDFSSVNAEQEAAMALSEDDGVAIGIRYTL